MCTQITGQNPVGKVSRRKPQAGFSNRNEPLSDS